MKSLMLLALTFVISQGTCFALGRIPKKLYDEKVALLEKCSADNADLHDQVEDLQQKAKMLATNMELGKEDLLNKIDAMQKAYEQEKAALLAETEEKVAEVDKLKNTYDSLMEDMKKEIADGEIQITQLQDKLTVSMVDKIVFNSGEAEVNEQGKRVLKRVADILKRVKDKQIRIEGHTDNIPIGGALRDKFPTNWELSTTRATAIARYLQEVGDIDPERLYAAGYSQFRPIADNSTREGRAKNRRIEIVLVPLELASAAPEAR